MIENLEADLKSALLEGDKLKADTLKMVKAGLQNKAIENKGELSDTQVEQVLRTEVKKRTEAAEMYQSGGNQPSADKELAEAKIIEVYLPKQMSDEELETLVVAVIDELGDQASIGQIIQTAIAKAQGQAESSKIAGLVNKLKAK